tara:strand:- start:170 stop:361 length:192 start_codon:yes stop_codon:yes gene_type:complete
MSSAAQKLIGAVASACLKSSGISQVRHEVDFVAMAYLRMWKLEVTFHVSGLPALGLAVSTRLT